MDKIEKILLSGFVITLPLPFIFIKEYVTGVEAPDFQLFTVPFLFFIVLVLRFIWRGI